MLGWGELISGLIGFATQKIVSKRIDIRMDDKRRAARSFLELYHAVCDLEVLNKELLTELRTIATEKDAAIAREWLRNVSAAVDVTSQRFLAAGRGLGDVIAIFDPPLANAVGDLEGSKFSFLMIAAEGLRPPNKAGDCEEVRYTFPSDAVGVEDQLEQRYEWYCKNYPLDSSKSLEWPPWVTFGLIEDESDVHADRLVLRDPASIERLAALLLRHVAAITNAREKLAFLIREKFSLEDLLSVRKPIAKFDIGHVMRRSWKPQ